MLNKMIEWWARNTVAANLLMMGIMLTGVTGFLSMDREIFPTIRAYGVEVNVTWPGADPQEVEEQILIRIEEAVSDLDNIDWVLSRASEGYGEVDIRTFSTVDQTQFINDVKNRIDAISTFPRDIEPPQVRQWIHLKN